MKRRFTIWLLVAVFVVGVVVRILHFPFRASAVMRVIPADAVFMSRHVAPGARVLAVLEDGLLDPLLRWAGFEGEHPGRDVAADADVQWMARRLGRRYVATAYVESFGGRPSPAMIASAWVGGRFTHLALLGVLDTAFPDFQLVRGDRHTRIWRGYFPEMPDGFAHISFGIYEGVAFGVASEDPLGAVHLYRVMRRQARSGATVALEAHGDILNSDIPDRLRLRGLPIEYLLAAIHVPEPEVLEVQFVVPSQQPGVYGRELPAVLSDLIPMVESSCVMLAGTTAGRGRQLLQELPLDPMIRVVAELLFTHVAGRREDAAMAVWVPGREHAGRMMRLRVPSLVMAIETTSGVLARDILRPVLQRMNASYNMSWGFVPHGQRGVLALTPSAGHWYGRLPAGERAGFAVWNGYAVFHSSADALDALLAAFSTNAARDPRRLPSEAGWYTWMNLPAAAEVLRMGFASYTLWQAMEGRARDRARETFWRKMTDTMQAYGWKEMTLQETAEGYANGVITLTRAQGEE